MVKMLLVSVMAILLLAASVSALGIVSDYLEENTLVMDEGNSKLYSIRIQNPEDREVQVKLTYNSDYLDLLEEKEYYSVPPKSSLKLTFNVTAPQVSANQSYTLGYSIQELGSQGEGLPIRFTIGRNFTLKVVDLSKSHLPYYPFAVVMLAIVLIGGWLYSRKHNKDPVPETKKRKRRSSK